LFMDCQTARPEIWAQIQEELKQAVEVRTISKVKK
jgi:hypothetical protein